MKSKVKEDGNGVSKLTIARVAPCHEATYTAHATNSAGEAKLLAHLSVSPPTPPPPQLEPPSPPTFTELFGNVTIGVGSQMVLQCRIVGNPPPKVFSFILFTCLIFINELIIVTIDDLNLKKKSKYGYYDGCINVLSIN